MSSRCLGTQWCGDDVLSRASSELSQGHRVDRKLNAPTVSRPQTKSWMNESPPPVRGAAWIQAIKVSSLNSSIKQLQLIRLPHHGELTF